MSKSPPLGPLLVLAVVFGLVWFLTPAPAERREASEWVSPTEPFPELLAVDLLDGTTPEDLAAFELRTGLDLELGSPFSEDEGLYVVRVADPEAAAKGLALQPEVEAVEPVFAMEAFGTPNDPLWDQQWNMRAIGVEIGWRVGAGRGARVAVIDTGVSLVEDLRGVKVEAGRTFVTGTTTAADDHGHGTHVAGTIAQATNNGLGVVGVAPEVTLVPYKVLSANGSGSNVWVAAAIDAAVDDGAHVINLSLGGPSSSVVNLAAAKAVQAGVVVVAAAGNTGRRGLGSPAGVDGVVAVSAVGPDGQRTRYSSFGPGVEIAAPGGDTSRPGGGILQDTITAQGGHEYKAFQGTSMASPHVAGAAAVLVGMGLSGQEVVDALLSTAVPPEGVAPVTEEYGHGRLDLAAAVRKVLVGQRGLFFLAGAITAASLGRLARLSTGAVTAAGLAGGVTAGGLFFLPLVVSSPGRLVELASTGLLQWPAALGAPTWAHFPLWVSVLPAALLAFVGGPSRRWGPATAGACAGLATGLFTGAASGAIDPWWLGWGLDTAWLLGNATAALLVAMAVMGLQRLERSRR